MDQPLQFYRRVNNKTQSVGTVDSVQLAQWSLETEFEMGKGVLRQGGRYSVILASFPEQAGALAMYDALRNAGYAAEIFPVKDADKLSYRVRIRQLPSRSEAQALADALRGKFGITEPRVSG
jgi:hypothetical protein